MTGSVVFAPLLPVWLVAAAGVVLAALLVFGLMRGLSGWWIRAAAGAVVLVGILNPSLQEEDRTPLSDIVIAVVDDSASNRIADRAEQTAAALAGIEAQVARLPGTELRVVRVGDGAGDAGTEAMAAAAQALAEEPRARVAGVLFVTDGQVHDVERAPSFPAPMNVILTGREGDWDRRLVVSQAPAFAILGEPVTLTLRIEDQGAVPSAMAGPAELAASIDGGEPVRFTIPTGQAVELPVTLPHGGINVIELTTPVQDGELTDRNNAAIVQINGVRDRLRVLLVSGEPHAGERTWRNLLKSDSAVDLVHFTILRPPDKQDGVPVSELSLIAFPTRELFVDKIDEFDLIIFDRYRRRGILPLSYLENVRTYVENGGAVLVSAGPDYAVADSLYRSPLGDILPGSPSGRVVDEPFLPEITDLGRRHPVTEALEEESRAETGTDAPWGRWFRTVEVIPGGVTPEGAQVVMSGAGARPLLLLDRVGEGRIALMASDHSWLWSRGYEGGGPDLELLRRLAHWLMQEPELEEETLTATARGQTMTIVRRTLGEGARSVTVTAPDGTETVLELTEVSPGRFEAVFEGPEIGLYRLAEGETTAVAALGPAAPREFEETIATDAVLLPAAAATNGGAVRIEDGVPTIRRVGEGRPAVGRGWVGITPREAYVTADVRITPFLPAWAFLLIAAGLTVGAWLREGRR
jgi:hypothetical protein